MTDEKLTTLATAIKSVELDLRDAVERGDWNRSLVFNERKNGLELAFSIVTGTAFDSVEFHTAYRNALDSTEVI